MKVVIQRCKSGKVTVTDKVVNKVDKGLVILVGISVSDNLTDAEYLAKKVLNLRIFDDENGVMNKSIIDIQGAILSISQFTLQATTSEGNRPSYINAMRGEEAIKLYEYFNTLLNNQIKTLPGVFGADMLVTIENDGPVTIVIDSQNKKA